MPRRRSADGSISNALIYCSLILLIVPWATPARSVVPGSPSGVENTTAPRFLSEFDHVGVVRGASGVYLRNGWVLTANHVGVGPLLLGGISYAPVPDSRVQLSGLAGFPADLILFKLLEAPRLPDLVLATGPRSVGETVVMVGNGRNRGTSTFWSNAQGVAFPGWTLASGRAMRWGFNEIERLGLSVLGTSSFSTEFDQLFGPDLFYPEAQGVTGDSGGAVFIVEGDSVELVGIMIARAFGNPDQAGHPLDLALYENTTLIADLHAYAPQIGSIVDRPDCDNGLDDDQDGFADYPGDSGCGAAGEWSELPEARFEVALVWGVLILVTLSRGRAPIRI